METFIAAIAAAALFAPLAWPPFVVIYRYFAELEAGRSIRETATPGQSAWPSTPSTP